MKKWLLGLTASFMLLGLATGCSNTETNKEMYDETNTNQSETNNSTEDNQE